MGFGIDNEYMLGSALLVHPIVKPGDQLEHHGEVSVPTHPDRIPVYQRGGSITPKKERIRRSSSLMAKGHLYIDDGKSFNYKTKEEFVLIEFDFSNDKLTGHLVSKPGFECKSWLERVIVMGYDKQKPVAAKIVSPTTGEETLKTSLSENKVL